ncbi:hypothetical protein [Caldimonas tepidiphila]|uniref:hypothetical protein n=1 Tax=Caldimonas tepidiphila TaxID=2315841 RepID=UPI000E5AA209|nr:hypothetical protein [Caldimonas tepidiphila]
MISSTEAEALAKQHIQAYVNACGCNTVEDVGNVLMKLVSLAGITMCATVGQADAVARLEGTTRHIANRQFSTWRMERAN